MYLLNKLAGQTHTVYGDQNQYCIYMTKSQPLNPIQKTQKRNQVFDCNPPHFTEPRSSAGLLCFLGVGAPFVPLNNAYYLDIYLCCNSFTCIPAEPVKLMDQQVIYCSMMIRAKRNRKYSYFSYLSFNEPVRQQHVSNS